MSSLSTYEIIYAIVKRIPRGWVATYGEIARLANLGGHARQVGYALNALPTNTRIPWHRVINAKGEISTRNDPKCEHRQRRLLEQESIVFDERSRVALVHFSWKPRQRRKES
jgi:methylated-DNA-protein-cysteine methyltransferase-like protein